jgi:hypothetical protein
MLLDELPKLLVEPGRVFGTGNTHAGLPVDCRLTGASFYQELRLLR